MNKAVVVSLLLGKSSAHLLTELNSRINLAIKFSVRQGIAHYVIKILIKPFISTKLKETHSPQLEKIRWIALIKIQIIIKIQQDQKILAFIGISRIKIALSQLNRGKVLTITLLKQRQLEREWQSIHLFQLLISGFWWRG